MKLLKKEVQSQLKKNEQSLSLKLMSTEELKDCDWVDEKSVYFKTTEVPYDKNHSIFRMYFNNGGFVTLGVFYPSEDNTKVFYGKDTTSAFMEKIIDLNKGLIKLAAEHYLDSEKKIEINFDI